MVLLGLENPGVYVRTHVCSVNFAYMHALYSYAEVPLWWLSQYTLNTYTCLHTCAPIPFLHVHWSGEMYQLQLSSWYYVSSAIIFIILCISCSYLHDTTLSHAFGFRGDDYQHTQYLHIYGLLGCSATQSSQYTNTNIHTHTRIFTCMHECVLTSFSCPLIWRQGSAAIIIAVALRMIRRGGPGTRERSVVGWLDTWYYVRVCGCGCVCVCVCLCYVCLVCVRVCVYFVCVCACKRSVRWIGTSNLCVCVYVCVTCLACMRSCMGCVWYVCTGKV
jgi:hypothetical protein